MGVSKAKKAKEDKPSEEGVGMNIKSIVIVALMMVLMLFAVHCTWVTSNAYSSPSIVLASYGHDGYVCVYSPANFNTRGPPDTLRTTSQH